MKYIGRVLGWILLGINICMAVLLLICAYSSYINPVAHPVWSCAGLAFPAFLITNVLFFFFWLVVYRWYALVSLLTFFCCFGGVLHSLYSPKTVLIFLLFFARLIFYHICSRK